MITEDDMLNEAIIRMKMLRLHPNTIEDLKMGLVHVSDPMGILYWANEEQEKIIRKFEAESGYLVYHALLTPTNFGMCLSLLFISKYNSEWQFERMNMEYNRAVAMVINLDDASCSECGIIGIKSWVGGVIRTA